MQRQNFTEDSQAYENTPQEIAIEVQATKPRALSKQPMPQALAQYSMPVQPATTRPMYEAMLNIPDPSQQAFDSRRATSSHEVESRMHASSLYEQDNPTLESGILNLHNHLKSLEGKYIDLANFYKQELLSRGKEAHKLKVGPSPAARKNI